MQNLSCELQLETPQLLLELNRERRLRGLLGNDWTERDVGRPLIRTQIARIFRNRRTSLPMKRHANPQTKNATHQDGHERAIGA